MAVMAEVQRGSGNLQAGMVFSVPVHSTEGAGLPVAVQRNSARWPCWMVITGGWMVAMGLVTMPATTDKEKCEACSEITACMRLD